MGVGFAEETGSWKTSGATGVVAGNSVIARDVNRSTLYGFSTCRWRVFEERNCLPIEDSRSKETIKK